MHSWQELQRRLGSPQGETRTCRLQFLLQPTEELLGYTKYLQVAPQDHHKFFAEGTLHPDNKEPFNTKFGEHAVGLNATLYNYPVFILDASHRLSYHR